MVYKTKNASPEQCSNLEIEPHNNSIQWEELDEDLSLESFFDFKRQLNYAKI